MLQAPSTDQQEAVNRETAKIREEARKGSTGETVRSRRRIGFLAVVNFGVCSDGLEYIVGSSQAYIVHIMCGSHGMFSIGYR